MNGYYTVQQLIDKLQEVEDKELLVVLETDHGQTPMKLGDVELSKVADTSDYMMDRAYDEEGNLTGGSILLLTAY